MIDIHSHILTGLDDGARTLEEAVEMVRMAVDSGTTDIVASPHANDQYAYDLELIEDKITELLEASKHAIRIHRGCDFHLSTKNLFEVLKQAHKYTVNGKSYLLTELPDLMPPPSASRILARLQSAGLMPIITHPERNTILQDRISEVEAFVNAGCLIQVTAMSLLGGFGKPAQRASEYLLDRGWVHFVASDAHDVRYRPPILSDAHRAVTNLWGTETAEALFITNPMLALRGSAFPGARTSELTG
jgi:protein-tyrosine phosphatase